MTAAAVPEPLTMESRLRMQRDQTRASLDALVAASTTPTFTADEARRFDELMGNVADIDRRLAAVAAQQQADQRLAEFDAMVTPTEGRARVSVGREPRTYDEHPGRYLRDVVSAQYVHDPEAIERLTRHRDEMAVERRAVGASVDAEVGYFVPPMYALDDFAEYARAARPFADAIGSMPLPVGIDSVKIPRLTTGTKVAVQDGDNAAITTRDVVTAETTASLVTVGGYIDVSVQALDQSPAPVQDILLRDLMADYAAQLDTLLWSGTGTSGEPLGVLNLGGTNTTTYTDTTPTLTELYPKVGEAISKIHATRHLPAEVGFMHPTRWAWITSRVDSEGRPLAGSSSSFPQNVPAYVERVVPEGRAGIMQGIPWILDAGIPATLGSGTDEDRIVVARITDARLWEGSPRILLSPVTDASAETLTVRLKFWRYVIFLPGRQPSSWSIVGGSGLSSPVF